MKSKFTKPEKDIELNPVDYFNQYGTWKQAFPKDGHINLQYISETEINFTCLINGDGEKHPVVFKDGFLIPPESNLMSLTPNKRYSKFMLYALFHHKGDYKVATSHIEFFILNKDVPYIRVGCDYFKVFVKKDRYGVDRKIIKGWKKDEIKQDHGKRIMEHIHLYDDFTIVPDNTNHKINHDGCYNLYAPFNHEIKNHIVKEEEIKHSLSFLRHIFADDYDMGLQYLKIIYEQPMQALPILCLISQERSTGKTTFLNWMDMIFGDNYIQINPKELESQFNYNYAVKDWMSA